MSRNPELTLRETQVLRLYAEGWSRGEVGARLGIADNTVRIHTNNAFRKLGATSRIEAFLRLGWLTVPS